jgi:phage baseplate assembly protein W
VLPDIELLTQEIEETKYYGKTYKVETVADSEEDRINGYIDEIESVKQAIYLILSTERYAHIIYSWDYGIELVDLIGKPIPYCMAVIPRRVKEALLVDNRIENVTDFQFEHKGTKLHTTFTVVTNIGNVETRLEVDI